MAKPFGAITSAVSSLLDRWRGTGYGRYRLFLPGARFDYEREAGDLWANGTVAIALNWIGDRAHRPRIQVSRLDVSTGNYLPLGATEPTKLWERPNPHYTRQTLERAINLSLATDGNAFLLKVRSGSLRVVQLWWLDPSRVAPLYPSDGSEYLSGWRVHSDDGYYDVLPSEMVHIRRGIDPRNDRLGLSALKAQLREICSDNEVSVYVASLLRNSGVPGLMVVPDSDDLSVDEAGARRIQERVADTFSGEGRGRAVVLTGKVRVEQVGYNPDQLALDKLPQLAMAKIAASLGVPLMALGLPDPGKTYSNVEMAVRIGWGAIQGTQDLVADAIRWQLLEDFGLDPYIHIWEYDYSQVTELQEDEARKSDRIVAQYQGGVVTREEAREALAYSQEPTGEVWAPGAAALPTLDLAPGLDSPAATEADVQVAAINSDQIQSLVDIVSQVAAGQLPLESARAIIAAAFPSLSAEQLADILGPLAGFEADKSAPNPFLPKPPAESPGDPQTEADQEAVKAATRLLERLEAKLVGWEADRS